MNDARLVEIDRLNTQGKLSGILEEKLMVIERGLRSVGSEQVVQNLLQFALGVEKPGVAHLPAVLGAEDIARSLARGRTNSGLNHDPSRFSGDGRDILYWNIVDAVTKPVSEVAGDLAVTAVANGEVLAAVGERLLVCEELEEGRFDSLGLTEEDVALLDEAKKKGLAELVRQESREDIEALCVASLGTDGLYGSGMVLASLPQLSGSDRVARALVDLTGKLAVGDGEGSENGAVSRFGRVRDRLRDACCQSGIKLGRAIVKKTDGGQQIVSPVERRNYSENIYVHELGERAVKDNILRGDLEHVLRGSHDLSPADLEKAVWRQFGQRDNVMLANMAVGWSAADPPLQKGEFS